MGSSYNSDKPRVGVISDLLPYSDGGAGHRGVDTSVAGAEFIADKLPKLQADVFGVVSAAGWCGATGDETAAILEWPCHRVRPRTSELKNAGRIVDSGRRRLSQAGVASIVWITPEHLGFDV